MPIYEYHCDSCGKEFEILTIGMKDEGDSSCPECHSQETHRLMSRFGKGRYLGNMSDVSSNVSSATQSGCASCHATNCSSCGG